MSRQDTWVRAGHECGVSLLVHTVKSAGSQPDVSERQRDRERDREIDRQRQR